MKLLRSKYDAQKQDEEYKKLRAINKVIDVWDDHDYGINDGEIHYSKKTVPNS